MKNKDFDSFNNDRILAARKRVIDLLYLIGSWEEQKQQKQKPWKLNITTLLNIDPKLSTVEHKNTFFISFLTMPL